MIVTPQPVISLFSCYAYEDIALYHQFDKHLAMLKQLGWIQSWSEHDVPAGAHRQEAINQYLCTVDILLLFISADFLNSEYGSNTAMQEAVRKHLAGDAVVVPILLRLVEWQKNPLGSLQMLPRDAHPVTSWDNPDEAFTQIAAEIRGVIEALRRPVVLVSTSSHQIFATHLVQDLSTSRIPIWQETSTSMPTSMKEGIREASAVVIIASSETIITDSLKEAVRLSDMYQRPVVGVWIPNEKEEDRQQAPSMGNRNKWIDVVPGQEDLAFQEIRASLHRLRHAIAFSSIPPSQELELEPRNPYKGLRAFTSADTRDFFGRTSVVKALLTSMETILSQEKMGQKPARLLTVVGASGSGKSSVVKAGLLPTLQSGEVLDSVEWVYLAPIVPGVHPLDALVLALFEYFPEKTLTMLRDDLLNESMRGLHWLATALARRQGCTHVVLVVDQFEEIFTLTTDGKERRQFFDLLVTASTQPNTPLIAVLTLRADFYDRSMQYPALYTLIAEHQIPLLSMALPDLRAVITQPAKLPDVNLTFEEHLVGDMLFDIQGQIGALPLLQFTLDQLFTKREGRRLTVQAYQEIGGVKGALAKHAEETYQALPSEKHCESARTLFLRLIDPGFTEQDMTRRRARRAEIVFVDPEQTRLIQETMDIFVKARLLTVNAREGTEATIEVSHEAVLREWKRLAVWLHEASVDIRFQQSLSEDVTEWSQRKRPQDRLYRGVQLKEARDWAKRNKPSEQETTFLRASVKRRVTSSMILILVVLLLLSSTGVAGWYIFLQPQPTLVTTLQDKVVGSLRWCVDNAPTGSTIRFASGVSGVIELTGGDLTFQGGKKLTLVGPGAKQLAISGGDLNAVIHVSKKATLNVSGLSFKDSQTFITAFLFNEGTLTVADSIISNNKHLTNSVPALGGGIFNDITGILMLTNSILSNNTASTTSSSIGGGIDNEGKLSVTKSIISGNMAMSTNDTSFGGGINNKGTAKLTDTTLLNNTANSKDSQGGGISNDGNITLINSTLSNNTATSASSSIGGGISNVGTVTVTNSTLLNNTATSASKDSFGGGIESFSTGTVTITDSTLSNNAATSEDGYGEGGGIINYGMLTVTKCSISGNGAVSTNGAGIGGGISNSGKLTITDSTLSNNTATSKDSYGEGGGIENQGTLAVINSTLSNNTASSTSNDSGGGGIFNYTGPLAVANSTLFGNMATSTDGASFGGGICNYGTGSDVTLSVSIVAANNAQQGLDIAGLITSGGYNLIQDITGVTGLNATTDKQVTLSDLKLDDTLRNNGGPTQTFQV